MTAAALDLKPAMYKRGTITYASIDAANWSTVKHLTRSPKHYRHVLESGVAETGPMRLGAAAHTAVLEPADFTRSYAIAPCSPDGKPPRRGTKAWDEFAVANDGKTLLKEPEFATAMRVRDAVRSDPLVMRYLKRGEPELTLVWQDSATGVWCKGRLDWLSTSVPDVIVELKTAADVSPAKFQSAYARMMYHAQAAFYCDGLEAITGRPAYHKCVSVESKEPHDVVVYDVIGDPLEVGREIYRDLLRRLVECRKTNEWLGHGAGAEVSLRLPAWAVPDEADDLADLGLEL
jgi:hypothetical protein